LGNRTANSTSDSDRTINDFGEQWSHFGDNDGFYASTEILEQVLGPLASIKDLENCHVADIGSGTGRIVHMLLNAGVAHVVAVEPSEGVEILRENTRAVSNQVEILHACGDELPPGRELDYVISIGVIQFIEDPVPTLRAAFEALRPGGKMIIWVYAVEGNRAYVALVSALRAITTRLPHSALSGLCGILAYGVDLYIAACRVLPLPMRDYMLNTHSKITRDKCKLTIYDQLNPSYVKYYRGPEVESIFEAAGFEDIQLYHRQNYSWTAIATRPSEDR
jgi:SAM-dependent methyltransferase